MIFFMTLIIPPSNLAVELSQIQKKIFQKHKLIPTPLPLLITSIQRNKPQQPTRRKIAEIYPQEISIDKYSYCKNGIMLKIKKSVPVFIDNELLFLKNDNQGIIISTITSRNKELLVNFPFPEVSSFTNYSLACFKINSDNTPFWLNVEWEKIWEVKKGKKQIH